MIILRPCTMCFNQENWSGFRQEISPLLFSSFALCFSFSLVFFGSDVFFRPILLTTVWVVMISKDIGEAVLMLGQLWKFRGWFGLGLGLVGTLCVCEYYYSGTVCKKKMENKTKNKSINSSLLLHSGDETRDCRYMSRIRLQRLHQGGLEGCGGGLP